MLKGSMVSLVSVLKTSKNISRLRIEKCFSFALLWFNPTGSSAPHTHSLTPPPPAPSGGWGRESGRKKEERKKSFFVRQKRWGGGGGGEGKWNYNSDEQHNCSEPTSKCPGSPRAAFASWQTPLNIRVLSHAVICYGTFPWSVWVSCSASSQLLVHLQYQWNIPLCLTVFSLEVFWRILSQLYYCWCNWSLSVRLVWFLQSILKEIYIE